MSEQQYGAVIANLIINQTMLVTILKCLGVKEKEMDKLGDLGVKTAEKCLESIKEMEKKNGK